ncbi:hypothetical protein DFH07DRAFT_781761 [Mycena maculata]|uniref:Uncharacterized protein n=1 Tax=Mycena maculata TaxID=230809 RepID=A0AAD7HWL6_9AGAR|nr:hypothetical protein DFH07DRAFT_781761 [Mycena maculata]
MRTNSFRLATQLDRSRDLPLRIKIMCASDLFCTEEEKDIFRILLQHSARWETISLDGCADLYSGIRNRGPLPLPILRTVRIEMWHDDDSPPLLDMFQYAPQLQEAFINKELWRYVINVGLPWPQLFRYGGSNSWSGHLEALCCASNLVECTLDVGDAPQPGPPHVPILMPQLLRLSLSHYGLLACLETLALVEFYCNCDCNSLSRDLPLILRRLPCTVEKLVLSADKYVPSLVGIVEAVPTVKHLGFLSCPPPDMLRSFLGSVSKLAPALEQMAFYLDDAEGYENLLGVAESSVWVAGRLPSLRMAVSGVGPNLNLHRIFSTEWNYYRQGVSRPPPVSRPLVNISSRHRDV